jgi:hypothetical protein
MPCCHAFNSPQDTEENDLWIQCIVDTFDDGVTSRNLIKTLKSLPGIKLNVDQRANFRPQHISKCLIINLRDHDIK